MDRDILSDRAFEIFFREYYSSVFDFLYRYTGDENLSKDLAQTTFLRIYEQREKIVKVNSAKAFLYTIARHLYWNHSKHEKISMNYADQFSEDDIDDYNFLHEVTRDETIRILRYAIRQLPSRSREVILLNMEGKNNVEVAETLNISLNTVKSLKKTAYVVLRKILSKEYIALLICLLGD
ncbi:RNA polymerase sigma factor [Bacteroides heparinolyticus]|uniref:RNA polymerase sigma factor n=1 Tax=Prevotella heparinolytica TaxID=28113 RepID=UPI00359F9F82